MFLLLREDSEHKHLITTGCDSWSILELSFVMEGANIKHITEWPMVGNIHNFGIICGYSMSSDRKNSLVSDGIGQKNVNKKHWLSRINRWQPSEKLWKDFKFSYKSINENSTSIKFDYLSIQPRYLRPFPWMFCDQKTGQLTRFWWVCWAQTHFRNTNRYARYLLHDHNISKNKRPKLIKLKW